MWKSGDAHVKQREGQVPRPCGKSGAEMFQQQGVPRGGNGVREERAMGGGRPEMRGADTQKPIGASWLFLEMGATRRCEQRWKPWSDCLTGLLWLIDGKRTEKMEVGSEKTS